MSAKQTQARVRQTAVSVTIEHGRNRMNTGGRTLGLEGSTATGLVRGAQEGGPERGRGGQGKGLKAKHHCGSCEENKRSVRETDVRADVTGMRHAAAVPRIRVLHTHQLVNTGSHRFHVGHCLENRESGKTTQVTNKQDGQL